MAKALNTVLAQIAQKKPPAVILVGGSSDYLSERAFRDIREAIIAAQPNVAVESFEPGTDLAIVVDYVLEPDSNALKVTTSFKTNGGEAMSIGSSQFGLIMGDGGCAR